MSTNDLVTLIRNLSKSEKKNFTRYAQKQDSPTQYFMLYHEIEKIINRTEARTELSALDEYLLETKLKKKKVKGNIQTLKNYLGQAILRSLRILHENTREKDSIEMMIKDAYILEKRGLLVMASHKLEPALSSALEYGYHALAIEILSAMIRVEFQLDSPNYALSIQRHLNKLKELMVTIAEENGQFLTWCNLVLYFRTNRQYGLQPQDCNLQDLPENFLGRIYFFQSQALNYMLNGRPKDALIASENGLKIWNSNPKLKTERLNQYVKQVANYLNLCIPQFEFTYFENYLGSAEKIKMH